MNAEELTTVTEIISNLGDNAVTGLTYYLGVNFATEALAYGVGACAIIVGYKAVLKIGEIISASQNSEQVLRNVRNILGIGINGYVTEKEAAAILDKISQLKNKEEN